MSEILDNAKTVAALMAELERVKAQTDVAWYDDAKDARTRLNKALTALREIADADASATWETLARVARAAIAEIEDNK